MPHDATESRPVRNTMVHTFVRYASDEVRLPGKEGALSDSESARRLAQDELPLEKVVFNEETFPGLSRAASETITRLIGPHTVTLTYYNAAREPVAAPDEPGRYGCVMEVTPEGGRPFRRFRTLYRTPGFTDWTRAWVPAAITLPDTLGISPQVAKAQSETLALYLRDRFADALRRDEASAVLLAGLSETPPDAPRATGADDASARDRAWWVALKRQLYGPPEASPDRFTAPTREAGPAATTLRDGSEAEAGMAPGTAERIHAVCREWAEDSNEAFIACIARRGVIFHHQAYGVRDGQPMTTRTGSYMASISKLLAGTLLTMLADAGKVEMTAPVSEYLPILRGVPSERPLTLRHLMTHTAGMSEHWGDELHDFEERMALCLPHLEIGKRWEYNGASFALAGKVIEAVTGEALPQAFSRHLLQPLGMDDTDVRTMSWSTFSTAGDIARIGQLHLNQGGYGDLRFFRPEALQLLLPRRLTDELGPDATEEYGLGTGWFRDEGLGNATYGHGAASAATLRIDPDHNLVVVMTRNDAGRHFDTYHPRFMAAIAEGLRQA